MAFKKIILVDFDGVIHSYSSGWKGATDIPDEPVEGAFSFLEGLIEDDRFDAMIYSSRSKDVGGVAAMRAWFTKHDFGENLLLKLSFPTEKPAAFLTIDDRAFCFEGDFPSREVLDNFKPWNKR